MTRKHTQSFLEDDHIQRISASYRAFEDEEGFTRVIAKEETLDQNGNISILPLLMHKKNGNGNQGNPNENSLAKAIAEWQSSSIELRKSLKEMMNDLEKSIV